jgi:PPK2 family polyphosphate:nucleotide phosphotransferase
VTVTPADLAPLATRAAKVRDLLRVGRPPAPAEGSAPADRFDLAAVNTRATPGLPGRAVARQGGKAWSQAEVARIGAHLADQQERLFARAKVAGDRRRVLLVLQALDCGGKDGTIKRVAGAMNPLGLHIVAFGPPTEEERAHEFLWRIRRALPEPGVVGIFNRSHYEDVLAARVRKLVPKKAWQARFDAINQFEAELAGDGVTIIKVMLHISPDEQRQRLLDRLNDPTKQWKFNPGDLDDRARWTEFQAAYADALTLCNSPVAPWYVVPADRKWYRNWAVANLLLTAFVEMGLEYPAPAFDVEAQRGRVLVNEYGHPDGAVGKHKMNSS